MICLFISMLRMSNMRGTTRIIKTSQASSLSDATQYACISATALRTDVELSPLARCGFSTHVAQRPHMSSITAINVLPEFSRSANIEHCVDGQISGIAVFSVEYRRWICSFGYSNIKSVLLDTTQNTPFYFAVYIRWDFSVCTAYTITILYYTNY